MSCNINSRSAALTAGGEGGLSLQAPGFGATGVDDEERAKEEHPNLMELISTHAKFEPTHLIVIPGPINLQQALIQRKISLFSLLL